VKELGPNGTMNARARQQGCTAGRGVDRPSGDVAQAQDPVRPESSIRNAGPAPGGSRSCSCNGAGSPASSLGSSSLGGRSLLAPRGDDGHQCGVSQTNLAPDSDDDRDDRLLAVCREIWRGAEAEGVFVNYYGLTIHGESGYFHAREDQQINSIIAIFHPHYVSDEELARQRNNGTTLTDDELRAEIMTLAHERGHHQSWLRAKNAGGAARADWLAHQEVVHRRDEIADRVRADSPEPFNVQDFYDRLRAANQAELSDVDRRRIVDEETTAWRLGREILERADYDRMDEYDRRAEVGPLIYKYHLGMIPLEDVPEWARGQSIG
jgi:hypothetical protein